MATQALTRGKHVFIEKPLALNEEELVEVETAAVASATCLMVGFNRRFSPLAVELKSFLGGFAPMQLLYRVNAGAVPPGSWMKDPQQGGGRIIGEGCHFVDLMSFLCGSLPESVICGGIGAQRAEPQFDASDNLAASVSFRDGSVGTLIYTSMGDPSYPKEYLEVFASGKMAILDDFRSLTTVSGGKRKMRRLARQDKGHSAEVEAFVTAVGAGRRPISLEELVSVTRCTFAIEESLRTGSRVFFGRG
jgi:predicted dehydrogenase